MSAHRVTWAILGVVAALVAGGFLADSLGEVTGSMWLAAGVGFILAVALHLSLAGFWRRAREEGFFGEREEIVLEGRKRFLGWLFYAVISGVWIYLIVQLVPVVTTDGFLDYPKVYLFGFWLGIMFLVPLDYLRARMSDNTQ